MPWDAIASAIVAFLRAIFGRKPKTPIKEVETAHEVEDKNRAALRDGDSAKRLLSDWSK